MKRKCFSTKESIKVGKLKMNLFLLTRNLEKELVIIFLFKKND